MDISQGKGEPWFQAVQQQINNDLSLVIMLTQ